MLIGRTLATARDSLRGGHPSAGEPDGGGCCQYDRVVEPVGVVAFERLVAEALDGLPAEETPIGDWCAGFMEGVFSDESAWFQDDEEAAATLLLPFMLLSGLFDDEPDMAEMASDQANQEALVAQLPELVLDLYLHYRVPPETPKPKPRKKTPAKGKKRK